MSLILHVYMSRAHFIMYNLFTLASMTAEVKVVKSSGYKERGREDVIYNTKSIVQCVVPKRYRTDPIFMSLVMATILSRI